MKDENLGNVISCEKMKLFEERKKERKKERKNLKEIKNGKN